jgi:hypothetical protein
MLKMIRYVGSLQKQGFTVSKHNVFHDTVEHFLADKLGYALTYGGDNPTNKATEAVTSIIRSWLRGQKKPTVLVYMTPSQSFLLIEDVWEELESMPQWEQDWYKLVHSQLTKQPKLWSTLLKRVL